MFSGIIEETGKVLARTKSGGNLDLTIACSFAWDLQIGQSIAHNGVCLTVTNTDKTSYTVTAIEETLEKSNLATLAVGDIVNLERCMKYGDPIDGHFVQGHVDCKATCVLITKHDGSHFFTFQFDSKHNDLIIEKGSIAVNGVSLTVVASKENQFSVAIIPHTFQSTNFHFLKQGEYVNLEFDVLGKYVQKMIRKIQ